MSKKNKLTFKVKTSLVVGTATAALGAASCIGATSNPFPEHLRDTNVQDTSDAGDTAEELDTAADEDADEAEDAESQADAGN